MSVLTTVGYTADTMYFSPLDSPLELDHEIGANVDKTVRDCTQSYTGGTSTLYYSFYLLHLQFLMFLGVCSISFKQVTRPPLSSVELARVVRPI